MEMMNTSCKDLHFQRKIKVYQVGKLKQLYVILHKMPEICREKEKDL